jgi:hypothetical protein
MYLIRVLKLCWYFVLLLMRGHRLQVTGCRLHVWSGSWADGRRADGPRTQSLGPWAELDARRLGPGSAEARRAGSGGAVLKGADSGGIGLLVCFRFRAQKSLPGWQAFCFLPYISSISGWDIKPAKFVGG